jgi:hypothetical protein
MGVASYYTIVVEREEALHKWMDLRIQYTRVKVLVGFKGALGY